MKRVYYNPSVNNEVTNIFAFYNTEPTDFSEDPYVDVIDSVSVSVGDVFTGSTFTTPTTSTLLLANAKDYQKQKIDIARETALDSGVSYNSYTWDSDERSRANVNGTVTAINAGIPLPSNFVWRTKDNQNVPMTDVQMVALGAVLLSHVNTQYNHSWTKKAAIDACTTIEDVQAVEW